jgi:hypothetical protein
LTDESVCPTLARMGLRFCGAGAFACQPISSQSGERMRNYYDALFSYRQ